MKKQSDFSRLMGYAGRYRVFTYASWVLSAISALTALVPFVYIWKILRDVLNAAPNYAQAVNIPHYGWMAVLFAVLSYLIYIAALMCSHLSAFRVATNLRLAVSEHLAVLPLGFAENFGSGKLRKIIHESTGAAETYLAHQLPDQYNAIATPVGLLVLLLAFDWRLGLLSLAPVVLAFLILFFGQIFKEDFPFPPRCQHMGSVKGRMTNNNPAIGIMGIADMFLIGFVFSHGKSPFLRLWERAAALFAVAP